MRRIVTGLAVAAAVLAGAAAPSPEICRQCLLDHIANLAAPERHGRRCASPDEAAAADYLAGEMKAEGVPGALNRAAYVQAVPLDGTRYVQPPTLTAGAIRLRYGEDFIALGRLSAMDAPLAVAVDADHPPAGLDGALVLYAPAGPGDPRIGAMLRRANAAAMMTAAPAAVLDRWDQLAARQPGQRIADGRPPSPPSAPPPPPLLLKPAAVAALKALPPGTPVRLEVRTGPYAGETHNVVGVLHGTAPDADRHALLLSAHYDHLGVLAGQLYPGANDDASGTAAVLEFARALSHGPRPKRTVYFALFGCEEAGGYGSVYFRTHLPGVQLADLAADIEFEMVGYPDPKRPDSLMLTGWERSNLGPALAAHGARLGPDLHPEGNYFRRSDNYALALAGLVAHTVSAWPDPPNYHRPTDTYAALDKDFAVRMVGSLVAPLRWLADADFAPAWNPGGKP